MLLDTAGDCYTLGLIEYLVQQAGADKVLFGSDLTWIDPRTQLGMIYDADITAEAKQRILRRQCRRVIWMVIAAEEQFNRHANGVRTSKRLAVPGQDGNPGDARPAGPAVKRREHPHFISRAPGEDQYGS